MYNMWRLKDFFTNLYLNMRLWIYITYNSNRFDNVINDQEKDGWDLTFNDEFNKGYIDRNKWRTDAYYGYRYHDGNIKKKGESPTFYLSDTCFEFTKNTMKQLAIDTPIEIHHIDWDGKDWGKYTIPYQIGNLDSSKSFRQIYGYFEIRSKITSEPGSWPAFWLASTDSWPPEIDVYEIYTGKKNGTKYFNSNFHYGSTENNTHKSKVSSHKVKDVSESFHLYAVEWDEKIFRIYYDNLLVRVYSNPKVLEDFKYPMHIIVGNGVDDRKNRGLKNSKFPTYHEVDYIRGYKKK